MNLYTYVANNPLKYLDPSGNQYIDITATTSQNGVWDRNLGLNYVINEMKNKWATATTKAERDYWASEAEKIRQGARAAGHSNSSIMQSADTMIPMEEIMKQAHDMYPALSAIQGFTEGLGVYIENHPGEGVALSASMGMFKAGKITKLDEGLNFTVTTTARMENASRFVPVQTLISAVKYGKGLPDPQGSNATMYYTVMYKNNQAFGSAL